MFNDIRGERKQFIFAPNYNFRGKVTALCQFVLEKEQLHISSHHKQIFLEMQVNKYLQYFSKGRVEKTTIGHCSLQP